MQYDSVGLFSEQVTDYADTELLWEGQYVAQQKDKKGQSFARTARLWTYTPRHAGAKF